MDNTKLLQADYLDIIFDQRNKIYGGYELRKHYNQRVGKALLYLTAALTGLTCFAFVGATHKAPAIAHGPTDPYMMTEIIKPPPVLPAEPVKRHADPPPPAAKTVVYNRPVITDEPIKQGNQMTENKNLTDEQPGPLNTNGDPLGVPAGTGKGPAVVVTSTETSNNGPVAYVSQMPQFNGDMFAYLSSHIQYPEAARNAGIDGMVLVRFVVNEDGSVSDATVVRSVGGGCDEEAIRIVLAMPKWKPGKQNGQPVKVYFTLPIRFVLNG